MAKKAPSGLDLQGQRIVGLGNPNLASDAAHKGYVDGLLPAIPSGPGPWYLVAINGVLSFTNVSGVVSAPTLGTLTLSTTTGTVGAAYSGTISGKTNGSTLALSGAGAAGLTLSGTTVTGTPTAVGPVDLIETLAGATNTPHTTSGVLAIAAAPVTLGTLSLFPASATVGTAYTGTISGKTSGSTLTLSGAGAAGLSVSGTTVSGSPTAAGTVNVIETLAGATNTPQTSSGLLTVAAAAQGVTYATLNPADKTTGAVLSNGNLTLASTLANGTGVAARATLPITGRKYIEFRNTTTLTANDETAVGITTSASEMPPSTSAQMFYWTADGVYGADGTTLLAPAMGWTSGAYVGMAVDEAAKLIWFRVNGGNFNNNPSADPATGVGGISLSGFTDIYPCIQIYTQNAAEVVNFGATAFAYPVPTGYSGLSTSASSSNAMTDVGGTPMLDVGGTPMLGVN